MMVSGMNNLDMIISLDRVRIYYHKSMEIASF